MIAFIIHVPVIVALAWQLYRHSYHAPLRRFFWPGLLFKLLASVALGIVYIHYYTVYSDTLIFHHEAAVLGQLAEEEPLSYLAILLENQFSSPAAQGIMPQLTLLHQPRAFFMVKMVSLISVAALHNYWIIGWYLSLFSFLGMWRLANTLAAIYPSSAKAAAVAFLFFPSIVFWSAGLMKESIAVGCIGWLVDILLRQVFGRFTSRTRRIISYALVFPLCYLLWKLKYYYLGALLPVGLAYACTVGAINTWWPKARAWQYIPLFFSIFFSILAASAFLHPSLHPTLFFPSVVENHDALLAISPAESSIHFTQLRPEWLSLAQNLPLALFSGLFRPMVWEGNSVLQLLVGLENCVLLLLVAYALMPRHLSLVSRTPRHGLLLISALIYIAFLASVLAFSTPNLGTLSRYKVAYLPFLVYGVAWIASLPAEYRNRLTNPNKSNLHPETPV